MSAVHSQGTIDGEAWKEQSLRTPHMYAALLVSSTLTMTTTLADYKFSDGIREQDRVI